MRKVQRLGVLLLMAMLMFITATSCQDWRQNSDRQNYDVADSVKVAIEGYQNPSLVSVSEALELQAEMIKQASVDSQFMAMPQKVVLSVTAVLLEKNNVVFKKDIVEEFRQHSDIYNNLPIVKDNSVATTKDNAIEVDLGATDLENRRDSNVISVNYNYRTDTINGKPVRIKIKTIESHE